MNHLKIIGTAGLFMMSCAAQANDKELWAHIEALYSKIGALQTQINSIPQGAPGPMGPAGPKGERGPAGTYTAGEGISISNGEIKTTLTHYIGEEYNGGIIFWVDKTGQHGLIASKTDLNNNEGIQWRNGESGNKVTNARADGIYAGESNTKLIIAQQTIDNQSGTFAALLAANYRVLGDGITPCPNPTTESPTCYGGWYLPSAYELTLLHNNLQRQGISTFAPDYYWSSTESSVGEAWLQNFSTGELMASGKASTLGHVRAVSRF
ncbi:TPA: DUF1566 domain-containing protein [Legionella pneumophila]|nr:DUF1566 domain-containing protein [Legionella pneumophila]HCW6767196.1 DUF1566 domain-containing protein [Legionella pneumophila]